MNNNQFVETYYNDIRKYLICICMVTHMKKLEKRLICLLFQLIALANVLEENLRMVYMR